MILYICLGSESDQLERWGPRCEHKKCPDQQHRKNWKVPDPVPRLEAFLSGSEYVKYPLLILIPMEN